MATKRKSKKELLRQKAEKLLSDKPYLVSKAGDKDVKKLIHELQVHQVELEMQNEELRKAQVEIEESRTKYSDLYDFAPVGYFTFSQVGEIVEVNLAGASLLGVERTKLLQRSFSAFVDPEFRSLFRDHRLSILKKGKKERCELKLVKKDGKSFFASIESISIPHGRNFRIRSAVSDITGLKKAQEKAETEHAFRIAIENSILSGIAAVDLEGRQSYVNLGFCRMIGRSEEELVGRKPPFAYWPPEESDHISRAFQTIMNGKSPREGFQLRFMRKNGERFDALVLPSPLKDHSGKIIGWIGTFGDVTNFKQMEQELKQFNTQLEERVRQRTAELETANERLEQEITERKRTEEALRESKERYRSLATNSPSVIMRYDKDLRVLFLSPKAEEITGVPIQKFIGKTNKEVKMPERLRLLWDNSIQEVFRNGESKDLEFDFQSRKGTKTFYLIFAPEFGAEGEVQHVSGIATDITDRKRMEQELRESEERYRMLVETAPDAVFVHRDNRFLYANGAALKLYGAESFEQLAARTVSDLLHPEEREPIAERIRLTMSGEKPPIRETRVLRLDGQEVPVEATAAPVTYQGAKAIQVILRDITERKQTEARLASNLAALTRMHALSGRLLGAAGIQPLLQEIMDAAVAIVGAEKGTLQLLEADSLRIVAHHGHQQPFLEFFASAENRASVCGEAMRRGERVVVPDVETSSIFAGTPSQAVLREAGVRAVQSTPMLSRTGMLIGIITTQWGVPYSPDEHDLWRIDLLARQAADMIEYAKVKEELLKSRDELDVRVQERTAELMNAVEELQDEISERKRAEEAIQLQAELLATLLATTPDGFWVFDADGKLLDVNDAYCRMSGYSREELLRLHIPDIEVLETPEETARHIRKIMGTGFDRFESQHRTRDGRILDVEISVSFWPSADRFLLFARDITRRKRDEEALKAAHQYNRNLIETSLDPLVTIDADGKMTDVNKAAEAFTGVTRDRLIGSDFSDYFTEPNKAEEVYLKVFLSGAVKDYPLAIRHASGKVTDVLYNATLYRNERGEVQGVFAAARDVTERNEIQRRTEATNSLLNLFVKTSTRKEYLDSVIELIQPWSGCRCVGIRILNEKDYIPYESYVGFGQEFWESENLLSVKYDQCACIRAITGNPEPQDRPVLTPAGSFRCENTFEFIENLPEEDKSKFRGMCVKNGFKSVAIVPIRYRDRILGGIHLADEGESKLPMSRIEFIESMAPLIGEAINRFNLEEELKDSEARLRYLSSQLLTVQENERRSIALELHDGVGQMLTAVKFKIESALQLKSKKKSLEAVIPLIKESIEEVRRVQMDLRPSTLDDLGVLATLEWFCREYQKIYSHIRIEKKTGLNESDVSMPVKTVIYRVTQEALNNIAKHSKATLVRFSLSKNENKIELAIQDNGIGFDLEEVIDREGSKRGLGLTSMAERTQLSGGSFAIESTPGKGTTLRALWPI